MAKKKFIPTGTVLIEHFDTSIGRVRRVTTPLNRQVVWQKPVVRSLRDPLRYEFNGTEWETLSMVELGHPAGEGEGAMLERLYHEHYRKLNPKTTKA